MQLSCFLFFDIMEPEELQDRFYEIGITYLNPESFRTVGDERSTAIRKGAKVFKKRFGGFLNCKARTEEETLNIIQETRLANDKESARQVMCGLMERYLDTDIIRKETSFSGGRLYRLESVKNTSREIRYKLKHDNCIVD